MKKQSFVRGRKPSVLSYEKDKDQIKIEDYAMSLKVLMIFMILIIPIYPLTEFVSNLGKLESSFLNGIIVGLTVLLTYLYIFKASTTRFVAIKDVESLVVIPVFFSSYNRLSLKLKNGKYRNIICKSQQEADKAIDFFKEIDVNIHHKKGFNLLPLNY